MCHMGHGYPEGIAVAVGVGVGMAVGEAVKVAVAIPYGSIHSYTLE